MSVGLELGPEVVRVVRLGGWPRRVRRTLRLEWDPARPEELVGRLRAELGAARELSLSVGIGLLHLKQLRLPPVAPAERRRMVRLEPDRFFPVAGETLAVQLDGDGALALAAEAGPLERWIEAFGAWAPVRAVEGAPVSLARALAGASGSWEVHAGAGERGLVEVEAGRLRSARRVPAGTEPPAAEPLPALRGLPGEFLPALGAALAGDGDPDAMLLPPTARRSMARSRIRRVAVAAAACLAAALVAGWAVDDARERSLERLRREVALLEPRARGAERLQQRLEALRRERGAVQATAQGRSGVLPALAALGGRLPPGAWVQIARARGADWEVQGTADDAAALVPLLDADPRLEEVRFLAASDRFREEGRTLETFSIAFRAAAQP